MTDRTIRLVVFDMAGTIVDYGSFAPIGALIAAFAELEIDLTADDARRPMGLHKRDHIAELLRLKSVSTQWNKAYGRAPIPADAESIYQRFLPLQVEEARQRTELIPGALSCLTALRERNIAVATTTGYPRVVGEQVVAAVAEQGWTADYSVFADDVPAARPAPWMIFRAMEATGVFPASAVVKVGDTVPDMEEGRNAGTWCVGVNRTGSEVGMTQAEWKATPEPEQVSRLVAAGNKLLRAGAHEIIHSVDDFSYVLDKLEAKASRGKRP